MKKFDYKSWVTNNKRSLLTESEEIKEKKAATNCPCPDWHPEAPEGPGCCGEVIAQYVTGKDCPCPKWHPEYPRGKGCCGEVIAQYVGKGLKENKDKGCGCSKPKKSVGLFLEQNPVTGRAFGAGSTQQKAKGAEYWAQHPEELARRLGISVNDVPEHLAFWQAELEAEGCNVDLSKTDAPEPSPRRR